MKKTAQSSLQEEADQWLITHIHDCYKQGDREITISFDEGADGQIRVFVPLTPDDQACVLERDPTLSGDLEAELRFSIQKRINEWREQPLFSRREDRREMFVIQEGDAFIGVRVLSHDSEIRLELFKREEGGPTVNDLGVTHTQDADGNPCCYDEHD